MVTIGYLIGIAISDLVFTIPVYIVVAMVMSKVVKNKSLKIFGICLVIIALLMAVVGKFTFGDIAILPIDIALCIWLGDKHYFDMHKHKNTYTNSVGRKDVGHG